MRKNFALSLYDVEKPRVLISLDFSDKQTDFLKSFKVVSISGFPLSEVLPKIFRLDLFKF